MGVFGSVDASVGAILAAVIPLALAIVGGGFGMAWRLGGLERAVKDVQQDVSDTKDDIARIQSDVGQLRGIIGDRRRPQSR